MIVFKPVEQVHPPKDNSGQISIIPKPECFVDFGRDYLTFHHHHF